MKSSGYHLGRAHEGLPTPKGNAPLCACGCGNRTSTVRTKFILGHRVRSVDEILEGRTQPTDDGCIVWTGAKFPNGYGQVMIRRKRRMVHRVVYEGRVGPIPEGLVIDHLCRNRACVNPEHMEPVTPGENSRRGGGLDISHAKRRRIVAETDTCPHGHPRSEFLAYDKQGKAMCVQCGREASLRYYHRRKAKEKSS